MKKFAFTLAAIALFAVSCTKDAGQAVLAGQVPEQEIAKSVIEAGEEDPAIVSFVAANFPETGIATCEQMKKCYRVVLADSTVLRFNEQFAWKKIDCVKSTVYTSVPEGLVPEAIAAYVTEHFPEAAIVVICQCGEGWKIRLNNEEKVKFDAEFNVVAGKDGREGRDGKHKGDRKHGCDSTCNRHGHQHGSDSTCVKPGHGHQHGSDSTCVKPGHGRGGKDGQGRNHASDR